MKLALIRIMIVLFLIGESLLLLLWGSLAISIQLTFIGLPAFLVTLWLLILHVQGFRQLNKTHFINQKTIRKQKIAGVLLISICTAILMYILSFFNELGTDGSIATSTIISDSSGYVAVLFVIPVSVVTFVYFWLAKSLARENVTNSVPVAPPPQTNQPSQPSNSIPPPVV